MIYLVSAVAWNITGKAVEHWARGGDLVQAKEISTPMSRDMFDR